MKFKFLFFSILVLIACTPKPTQLEEEISVTQYVDPFIGTGFHGHTFPGPTLPYGMVQLSPDTRLPGWDASSGYHYSDSTIYGFSHTHLSGTGIGDMGDILFLPFTGEFHDSLIGTFVKSSEQAEPGYYKVRLENFGVDVQLTATIRTGMHKYHFPKDRGTPKVMIDLGHILQANWGHKSLIGEMEIIDNRIVQGRRVSTGWANNHPVYFYAEFNQPFSYYGFKNNKVLKAPTLRGNELKMILDFGAEGTKEAIIAHVGISSVSREGAKANLLAQKEQWDFDQVKSDAQQKWEDALSKIQIETPHESVKKNFYTAIYHSMVAPMLANDVDGKYRGMDAKTHQVATGASNYTVFSMWDTFRALHPLMSIIDQKKTNEWIRSLLQKYKEGGVLPKWPLAANYTGTMVGYPSVALIADALAKGINDFDVNLALEAAIVSSNYNPELTKKIKSISGPRADRILTKHLDYIERLGFIPADSIGQSVSYGLECAYYDWCIAQIAEHAGKEEIKNRYLKRAKLYQAYFDSNIGFMRGKLANGQWREPFDPYFSDHEVSEFVEGNSWQWMWFVPHDVSGYIDLMGGKEAFAKKLDELFSASSKIAGHNASADITGLIGQYAHGNEPSHHVAHLYNYVGESEKAQQRIDQILQTLYEPTPVGISGNEDCGAMSAWYVLNALGFYQVCPGEARYSLGRPLVDKATIQLEEGGAFKIIVHNNSLTNYKVKEVKLNGQLLSEPFFNHASIQKGNVLEFFME